MPSSKFPSAILRTGSQISGESHDLVPWWSITKSVLAVATMRLVESKSLELDARFEDWPFTIKQLLHHTSGLTNYGGKIYQSAVFNKDPVWSSDELLSRCNARKLLFPPGTDWAYSNIGYMFIRHLIEQKSGLDINTALNQLVFEPLKISNTFIASTPKDMAKTLWGNATNYDPRWVYHGLLVGPPSDAILFMSGLLSGKLVSPETLEIILNSRSLGGELPNRPWAKIGYGLGFMIGEMKNVGRAIGHSGVGHDTVSALYAFPDLPDCPIVSAFSQANNEGLVEFKVKQLALNK